MKLIVFYDLFGYSLSVSILYTIDVFLYAFSLVMSFNSLIFYYINLFLCFL